MDITEKTVRIISIDEDGYDCKIKQRKNLLPFYYLTKKGYESLCGESKTSPVVVGDVFIHQRKYTDIEKAANPEKAIAKKAKKGIIGTATIPFTLGYLSKHPESESDKKYDLYASNSRIRRCIGYANIGNGQYVRLVTIKYYYLLILLLLLLIVPLMMKLGPKIDPITINSGHDIINDVTNSGQATLCYYMPFEEETILTKDNPEITLTNVATNENEYYISFSLYVNGNMMKNENGEAFTTGAIPPNKQVNINLWNELDEGVYELKAVATDYDFNTLNDLLKNEDKYSEREKAELLAEATMPVKHTLSTTLIIKK